MAILPVSFLGAGPEQVSSVTPYDAALTLPIGDAGGPNKLDRILTSRDAEWLQMAHYWKRVSDVRGGTSRIRAIAKSQSSTSVRRNTGIGSEAAPYLPKMSRETQPEWLARVDTAILLDFFVRGVEAFASKPFAGDPKVIVPQSISYLMDDADGVGTSFVEFCKTLFQEVFYNALVHVLVFLDDDDTPRLNMVHGPSMFSTIMDPSKGVEYARFCESVKKGSEEYEGVRESITETGIWSVGPQMGTRWIERERSGVDTGEGQWQKDDEFAFSEATQAAWGGQIPLSTAYAIKRGPALAFSPFWPVVDLTLKHLRALSEHEFLLRQLRSPITAIWDSDIETVSQTGSDTENTITSSGLLFLRSSDLYQGSHADIQVDPSAVESSKEDVDALVEQMATRTVSVLVRQPTGDETATAKAIDSAEEKSELSAAVTNMELMMRKALWFAASFYNASVGMNEIDVVFNRDFELITAQQAQQETHELLGESRQQAKGEEEE